MAQRQGTYAPISTGSDFKGPRLLKNGLKYRSSCCCCNNSFQTTPTLPQCIACGNYVSCIACEVFCQYGLEDNYALELCCSNCRCRRTPLLAPCLKFESSCCCFDQRCGIPCDEDIPFEIGCLGFTLYSQDPFEMNAGMPLRQNK